MHLLRTIMFFGLMLALAACDRQNAATTAPAAATVPAGPRIVSTVPAGTLNLVLIHAADRLVGVTKYDRLYLPEEQRNLPVVGDYETMDFEQLVALRPTALVIQTADARISPRLREVAAARHIELVNLHLETIDDIWASVRALGAAAGKQDAAETAILLAQAELKEVADTYRGWKKPRVLYVMTSGSMMVVGDQTIFGQMISLAGGINVGAEVGRGYPEIGREAVVKLAPDVLLIGAPDQPDQQVDDPRLEKWMALAIPATVNKRIYLVTDGNSQMASVDIGKNVRAMAEMIHRGDVGGAVGGTGEGTRGGVGAGP